MIKLNLENTNCEIDFASYADKVAEINKMINEKTGKGNDFLGWTTWPKDYDKAELDRIIKSAKFVRENFDFMYSGIKVNEAGTKVLLTTNEGDTLVVNMENYIHNELMNYASEFSKLVD